jgi:hypothetical protein
MWWQLSVQFRQLIYLSLYDNKLLRYRYLYGDLNCGKDFFKMCLMGGEL